MTSSNGNREWRLVSFGWNTNGDMYAYKLGKGMTDQVDRLPDPRSRGSCLPMWWSM